MLICNGEMSMYLVWYTVFRECWFSWLIEFKLWHLIAIAFFINENVWVLDILTNFCVEIDWKARADVAKMLKHLKNELTLLVVSHDLK